MEQLLHDTGNACARPEIPMKQQRKGTEPESMRRRAAQISNSTAAAQDERSRECPKQSYVSASIQPYAR